MSRAELEEAVGVDAVEVLGLLETRVARLIGALREARAERDALAAEVTARDERIEELEAALAGHDAAGDAMERMTRQRDDLLHERAAMARRVESILGLVEGMQLE